ETHTRTQAHTHTHTRTHTRSEEHTSELQSHLNLVCRLLLEKKKKNISTPTRRRTRTCTRVVCCETQLSHSTRHHRSLSARNVLVHTCSIFLFFFFNDTATTEIYTLSLHDALPI